MITTPDLIDSLSANLAPVRRLRPPQLRACCWLGLAVLVLALLGLVEGVRPDLGLRLHDANFVVRLCGAVMTGILAALAAFLLSLPDRSRLWLLLPAPALALWLSTLGYQCLTGWVGLSPEGIRLGEAARCFATLALTSLPLSLALLMMLRPAAPLRPLCAALSGGLAVGAIAATGLSLFHAFDATAMILAWNLGTAGLFVACASIFRRRLFPGAILGQG